MQRVRGFTLIELLVTLAIAGLLATIVAPSMSTFMARARLASDVNQVVSALNMARSEAIKRHQNVTITLYLPRDNIERRPACRNGEVLVSDDSEPIYNYPTGCYRITISDEDDDEGELLRKGETKYLQKCLIGNDEKSGKCSITFKSLGQTNCGGAGCLVTFDKPPGVQADNIKNAIHVRKIGRIRKLKDKDQDKDKGKESP